MTPRDQLIQKIREAARQAEIAKEPAVEIILIELVAAMHDGTEGAAAFAFLRSVTQIAIAIRTQVVN